MKIGRSCGPTRVACSFLFGAALAPTVARSFSTTAAAGSGSLVQLRRSFLTKQQKQQLIPARAVRGGAAPPTPIANTNKHQPLSSSSILSMSSSSSTSPTTTAADPQQQQETTATTTIMDDAGTKLQKLRHRMQELDLDLLLVPTDDPHLSEYVPAAYMRRAFLTDFHGSAGTAVVTARDGAHLWTDSRYWNEANLQLDGRHWTLQKQGLDSTVPTIPKWICDTAKEHYGSNKQPLKIGLDPYVHAASFAKELVDGLEQVRRDEGWDAVPGVLVTTDEHGGPHGGNLVDELWGDARPAVPASPFKVHPQKYAGQSVAEKLAAIREQMVNEEKKCTAVVFSTLDDVAYLFNLRAKGDIETCPVGIAYAMVTMDSVYLYCDERKVVAPEVQAHLREAGVTVKPYEDIVPDVAAHCSAQDDGDKNDANNNSGKPKVWMDTSRSNYALQRVVPAENLLDSQNPVTPMKACKNEAELAGMREAHIVDGVAMAHFMAWLEDAIVARGRSVSEVEIDEVLTGFRAQQPGFVECSFPTIAGVGANGAIIHYRASRDKPELLKHLDRTAPILIDSGGQYEYGTTDVTRTWSFQPDDKLDAKFVECYTRVLKGNMGLDRMKFPEQTPGFVLDVYARAPLWEIGLNYGHGTGHGVGAYLNVHEGPMSISPRWKNVEVLKRGMVLSNEPGYYEDGNFGVRIENLLEIQYADPEAAAAAAATSTNGEAAAAAAAAGAKKFLKFKKLTMIPIQKNLIDVGLMTDEELDWLDNYHAEVLDKVGSRLEAGSRALAWLTKACEKIDRSAQTSK